MTPQKPAIRKKTRTNTPISEASYEEFLNGLELISVSLKSCSCEINRDAFFSALKGKPKRNVSENYKVTEVGQKCFECEGYFKLFIAYPEEAARNLLSVECVYEVHMHATPEISKSFVERFTQQGLGLVLLPFARQLVSDLTSKMSIPPVTLPLAIGARNKAGKQ